MTGLGTLFFHYDYVDPASYILKRRLQEKEEIRAFTLRPRPFEINPPPLPLLDPEGKAIRRLWGEVVDEGGEVGVDLKRPWIVPWTRKAHELALFAKERNCFEEIHEALFRAYLIDGRDIGRVDVLVKIAGDGGLDPRDTKAVLDVDRHREGVAEARAEGLSAGITKPPALMWKDRKLEGYPSPEAWRSYFAFGADTDKT
jgi:predicted DsbA family dithiol-disulfide isomerase